MITIRICEESDARLMIKEGCFKEYVNMWIAHFPQRKLISQIKELHSKYGLGLFDANMVARAKGADEDVILEVGDNVLLRKKNDSLAIFQKIGDIWVKVDENLDIFDSEDILFSNTHTLLTSICEENKILHAKSVKALAKCIKRSLCCWYWTRGLLFSFGKHEIWKFSDNNRICIYSNTLKDQSIYYISEDEIAKHIECYRKAQRFEFGSF